MAATAESSLAELIADPLIGLVMRSDGVEGRCIEILFERIASSRAAAASGIWPAFVRTED
jgi:hypothetical protein